MPMPARSEAAALGDARADLERAVRGWFLDDINRDWYVTKMAQALREIDRADSSVAK